MRSFVHEYINPVATVDNDRHMYINTKNSLCHPIHGFADPFRLCPIN